MFNEVINVNWLMVKHNLKHYMLNKIINVVCRDFTLIVKHTYIELKKVLGYHKLICKSFLPGFSLFQINNNCAMK